MSNTTHRTSSTLRQLAKPIILGILIATTITVYAGDKRPNDECQEDADCRRGHCYTKRSDSKTGLRGL